MAGKKMSVFANVTNAAEFKKFAKVAAKIQAEDRKVKNPIRGALASETGITFTLKLDEGQMEQFQATGLGYSS